MGQTKSFKSRLGKKKLMAYRWLVQLYKVSTTSLFTPELRISKTFGIYIRGQIIGGNKPRICPKSGPKIGLLVAECAASLSKSMQAKGA